MGIILNKENMKRVKGKYEHRDIFVFVNDLYYLLSEDQNYIDLKDIRNYMSTLTRNAEKANIHFIISTSDTNTNILTSDIIKNTDLHLLLGDFNNKTSEQFFGKDISFKAMPNVKGRAFIDRKGNPYEAQIFYAGEDNIKYNESNLYEELANQSGIQVQDDYENKLEIKNSKLPKRKMYRKEILDQYGNIDYEKLMEG